MERKEALKYIKTKIDEGRPKHQIYRDLMPQVPYKADLLSYISEIPDLQGRIRHKPLNITLISVLVVTFLLQLFISIRVLRGAESEHVPWFVLGGWMYILVPMFMIFIIVSVWNYRREGYRMFFILAVLVLSRTIGDAGSLTELLLLSGPWILGMYLAIRIMKKAFPYERLFQGLDRTKLESDLLQMKDY